MSRRRRNALYWYALLRQASKATIDTFIGMRAVTYVNLGLSLSHSLLKLSW